MTLRTWYTLEGLEEGSQGRQAADTCLGDKQIQAKGPGGAGNSPGAPLQLSVGRVAFASRSAGDRGPQCWAQQEWFLSTGFWVREGFSATSAPFR